ncbi:hypothetical protein Hydth_0122 [Hydrogenobacter thermophilus TK-6]|uniref:Uncharacterized protein n=1 Tax=Hydrogenobacter thermophilus (strain DSM 6534 / IAM 12695 / TK-6) TaxID=608538 RepID=D3DFI6_HYDTT|nr:hypothetical protein [Hydrogenobacter thermophilus]ADO44532.1 hypothetical protein Hydth_0122 [Hydrogenobacter thermophilus TK-6]BAI68588.1 hypothetical protein HTH_0121 [Hydrogenobacter thermophilus TK-6]
MGKVKKVSFCVVLVLGFSYAQEKDCNTNPLRDHSWCKYAWFLCKKATLYRLDQVKKCIEESKSYDEGVKCFEKPWIEGFLQQ